MHCDDKRTISVLKQNIANATKEKINLKEQKNNESNESIKNQIQIKINELELFIQENKEQLETMN